MKLPSSQYRGVIRQRPGRWGAQVWNNNQSIWLGTFSTEVAAAEAYDIAVQSLLGCNARANFKPPSQSDSDSRAILLFLRSLTTTEIISMLRSHTYHEEFKRSLHSFRIQLIRQFNANKIRHDAKATRQLLFNKVLSLSDVGSQNRLLIPRQHAKHFPFGLSSSAASHGGVMIDSEDETGKIWKFQCAFWRGNRYHVLNGGWTSFVREKRLKQGDMISFWRVTDELDAEYLLVECDSRRAATVSLPTLEMPKSQPKRAVRLFGVNIPISIAVIIKDVHEQSIY